MILLLGTGGTIAASVQDAHNPHTHYAAGALTAAQLIASIPPLQFVPLQVQSIAQIDSKDMSLSVWVSLLKAVLVGCLDPNITGIVITHGTDTLEETAYFLHQALVRYANTCQKQQQSLPNKPIVLTAAMRPPEALSADGPQNLLDATLLAATGLPCGVVGLVQSKIWAATDLAKVHTYALDAFQGRQNSPLAWVEAGMIRWEQPFVTWSPSEKPVVSLDHAHAWVTQWFEKQPQPQVEILWSHAAVTAHGGWLAGWLQAWDVLQNAWGRQPLDGIIVAGVGNGNVHQMLDHALQELHQKGVLIRRTTRCPMGRVLGATPTQWLISTPTCPYKARIEMMLDILFVSKLPDFST